MTSKWTVKFRLGEKCRRGHVNTLTHVTSPTKEVAKKRSKEEDASPADQVG
jgi:hypothetical protein